MTFRQKRELNQPSTSSVSPVLLKNLASLEERTATVLAVLQICTDIPSYSAKLMNCFNII